MLVVTRFRVDEATAATFRAAAQAALAALADRPGWQGGRLARAADDASRWLMVTEWESVGAWRRALGAYDVKLAATPLLAQSLDEPSAFEVLYDSAQPLVELASDRAADADSVAIGEAAGPGRGWVPEQP